MALTGSSAIRTTPRWLADWFSGLCETVAPSLCLHCGGFGDRGWACEDCFAQCRIWDDRWCTQCAMPADHGHAKLCRFASTGRRGKSSDKIKWNECRALGTYDRILRSACLMAKSPQGAWITHPLAREWWSRHSEWAAGLGRCVIVPIPRHWSRRWYEGHDPAMAFALALRSVWAGSLGGDRVRILPALRRTRATPRLAGLDPRERARVVERLFAVRPNRISELGAETRIVLVDDICTTGATAQAAAMACRQAGARNLELAVIARTLEKLA